MPHDQTETIDGLEVVVRYRNVRTMGLYVLAPDAHIVLTVPRGTGMAKIENFVHRKRKWLLQTQERTRNSIMSKAYAASKEEVEQWRVVVKSLVPALIEKWEAVIGVHVSKLDYRNMKSRWGSCNTQTGRICINIRLALYPPECLEYVVVHELCHLVVPGHGKAFWALVERCLPHYKQLRSMLR